jgi:hypothetical protein
VHALSAIATGVRDSTSSPVDQVAVIVVAAVIVAALTWFAKRVSKKEASRTADMNEVKTALHEVSKALLGEERSPLNPRPARGVMKRLDDLWESHNRLKITVDRIDGRSVLTKQDTTLLVKDSETNKGSTAHDSRLRLEAGNERIESEQSRVRDELAEKEGRDDPDQPTRP